MEPFKTKLEQVTFSPSDHSLSDPSTLDSFSNIVAYDQDLVDESQSVQSAASPHTSFQESYALPRSPPSVRVSPSVPVSPHSVPTSNTSSQWSYSSRSRDGEDGIVNIGYQVYFQSPLVQLVKPAHPSLVCVSGNHPRLDDPSQPVELAQEALSSSSSSSSEDSCSAELPAGVHTHGPAHDSSQHQQLLAQLRKAKRPPEVQQLPTLPPDTSDALALQRSVIGSRSELLRPASEEDVERTISQIRVKLGLLSQENSVPINSLAGEENCELPPGSPSQLPAMDSKLTSPPSGLPIASLSSGYNSPLATLSPPLTPVSPVSRTIIGAEKRPNGSPLLLNSTSGLHQVNALSAYPRPELIPIPSSEITITKEGGRAQKTYQIPNDDIKNRLKAKARTHAMRGSKKKGARSPSDQGSETGRSTPSEYGDIDRAMEHLDLPARHTTLGSDDSEVHGLERLHYLDTSDLSIQPRPVISSTPFGTPGKVPPSQDMMRHDPGDVTRLLREKAHLQGQVEMLKNETQTARKDRSDLQSQLSAFKSQFKSSSGAASAFRDRENLISDLQTVRQERDRLFEKEQKLHRLLEERTQESSLAKVELDSAKKMNQKLQIRLDSNKQDVSGKSGELDELRSRLAVVGQELQTIRQDKRSTENQLRSTQNEMQAMSKTKDWYQEQLKSAQETRSTLQKEASKMQIQAMEQSSAIERLKSENTHIKHQMNESQQRALQEKENLVKHLERIEADMLEREAAVQQLQSDKAINEGSLYDRIKKVEEEKHQMAALVMTTSDLQNELAKMRNEMAQKDEHISLLEKDHAQMIKQVTWKQETATERQKELESLQVRFVELEAKVKELIGQGNQKDTEILSLKDQKAELEVALTSANEEKRTIDASLDTLRSDMETVESSFRMMKTEMAKKNQNLKEMKGRNQSLELELNRSKELLDSQQKSLSDLNLNIAGQVNESSSLKEKLSSETSQLQKEVSNLRAALEQATNDKQLMQEHIVESEKRIQDLGEKLSQAITDKMQLQNSVHLANSEEIREVQKENTTLRTELTEAQVNFNQALERKQKELERMEKDVWSQQERLDDLKARHSEEMRVVGDRLREAGEAQHKAEWQMSGLRKELSEGEQVGEERHHLESEIERLKDQLRETEAERDRIQTDVATLSHIAQSDSDKQQRTIDHLNRQLLEAQDSLEEYRMSKDESLKLALELEREKGRLSGVMQSHAALKEHTTDLEELLAEKESSLVDITVRTQQKLNEMSCHSSATNQRIRELEELIQQEQEIIHDLRQHLAAEKLESGKLTKQTESLTIELEQTVSDLNQLRNDLTSSHDRLSTNQKTEDELRQLADNLKLDLDEARTEVASLRRLLDQNKEKDPVMDDAIKTLRWEVEQKGAELAAWDERSLLSEERQRVEMDAIRGTLKTTKDELDKLRSELSRTRKERFGYQAKLSELRGTVKACLQGAADEEDTPDVQNTALMNGVTNDDQQSALVIIDKILEDATTPDYDSKPLAALHQCMSSLRNQMSGLQSEIDHHALAVINTSQSWKQVESQVQELRDLCGSEECSVRSDSESATSSQTAEDLVEKLLANGKTKLSSEQSASNVATTSS